MRKTYGGPVFLLAIGALLATPAPAAAKEIWIVPNYQQDQGGVGAPSGKIWPATIEGRVRFSFAVPADLMLLRRALVVLIPETSGVADLELVVCRAEHARMVGAACVRPKPFAFKSAAFELLEIDVAPALAGQLGKPGVSYIAVEANTTATLSTDRFVGLRLIYDAVPPSGVATLGANTFSGAQTAPAFIGDGSGLTNLPTPPNMATLGANVFHGDQILATGSLDLDAGNLHLPVSSRTAGNITKNGFSFLHALGSGNTFLGQAAGNLAGLVTGTNGAAANTGVGHDSLARLQNGSFNSALGSDALFWTTSGMSNTAVGASALEQTTTAFSNSAVGAFALRQNTTGNLNTAVGMSALSRNTTGGANVAVGNHALQHSVGGIGNLALGNNAGGALTTGSSNIYLGAVTSVPSSESNTMRLGESQSRTFIAGVWNTMPAGASRQTVQVDSNGQFGTLPSSVRYKEQIQDMGARSGGIFSLRPVTFRYKGSPSPSAVEYGLIAEEVADVFPDLVASGRDGRPESVQYQTLNVLLLNELQKLQRRVEALERELADVRGRENKN